MINRIPPEDQVKMTAPNATPPRPAPPARTLPDRVDVIVVGGGTGRLRRGPRRRGSWRQVLQLEKLPVTGGSTVLSAGLSAFAGTEEQTAQGIDDSVELLRRDLLETGLQLNDPALVEVYCREQLPTYHWLKAHGVSYGTVHAASGQSVPRSHPTDTRRMLDLLLARAAELGVQLATGVTVERLERDDAPDSSRVTGVRASANGRPCGSAAGPWCWPRAASRRTRSSSPGSPRRWNARCAAAAPATPATAC